MKNIKWNEVTWYSRAGALLLFLAVIPIIAFVVGMKYQEVKDMGSETIKAPLLAFPKNNPRASVSFATSTHSTVNIQFRISTPVISLSEGSAEKNINESIKKDIAAIEAKYGKDIAEAPCKDAKGKTCQTSVDILATTSVSQRFGTLSIEYSVFISSEQMAHPDMEIEENRIYDLITGEVKRYERALETDKEDLLIKMSEISRKKLKSQFSIGPTDAAYDAYFKGTEPKEENFTHVMIGEEGISIHFSYYQIGPRPYGAPQVFISFKELGI